MRLFLTSDLVLGRQNEHRWSGGVRASAFILAAIARGQLRFISLLIGGNYRGRRPRRYKSARALPPRVVNPHVPVFAHGKIVSVRYKWYGDQDLWLF